MPGRRTAFVLLIAALAFSSLGGLRAGSDVPTTLPEISAALVARTAALTRELERELYGTRLGNELLHKASRFQAQAAAYQQAMRRLPPRSRQGRAAFEQLLAAFADLQQGMVQAAGAAPQAEVVFGDLSMLIGAARALHEGTPGRAPGGASNLAEKGEALSRFLHLFIRGISSPSTINSPLYGAMRADATALSAALDKLNRQIREGRPLPTIQASYRNVVSLSQRISARMGSAHPNVRDTWTQLLGALTVFGRQIEAAGEALVTPDRPVLIDPPAFEDLPHAVEPGVTGHRQEEIVRLCDQAAGSIDAYIRSLGRAPDADDLIMHLRELRNAVLALRQDSLRGGGARLGAHVAAIDRHFRQAARLHAGLVRDKTRGARPEIFDPLADIVQRLRRLLPG